jgi:hypothetical protein
MGTDDALPPNQSNHFMLTVKQIIIGFIIAGGLYLVHDFCEFTKRSVKNGWHKDKK